jgi:hypothetical protein
MLPSSLDLIGAWYARIGQIGLPCAIARSATCGGSNPSGQRQFDPAGTSPQDLAATILGGRSLLYALRNLRQLSHWPRFGCRLFLNVANGQKRKQL